MARIVTGQPFVRGEPPTRDEISDLMQSMDFDWHEHRMGSFWYHHGDGILVFDAEPGNLVSTNEGIIPIDLIIQTEDLSNL